MKLASRFHGEIINCDAMQMYEGLPIATNKISLAEQRNIPHHLLGVVKLGEEPWTVSTFKTRAMQIVQDIWSRRKLPILVGGTHYYIQSLLLRDNLVASAENHVSAEEQEVNWPILGLSSEEMLSELRKADPAMASRWHPNDTRKIRRSLEIYLSTGRKASELYEAQRHQSRRGLNANELRPDVHANPSDGNGLDPCPNDATAVNYNCLIFCIHAATDILRSQLDRRVEAMIEDGLLMDVESMHKSLDALESTGSKVDQSRGIWSAIGYKEFLPYSLALSRGECSAKQLQDLKLDGIEKTQIRTRQYARSQGRWIKGKLIPALRQHSVLDRFFVLGIDNNSDGHDVHATADRITAAFIQGTNLPEPSDIAGRASSILQQRKEQLPYSRYCIDCNKTLMTEDAWEGHLDSKKHKRSLRCKRS